MAGDDLKIAGSRTGEGMEIRGAVVTMVRPMTRAMDAGATVFRAASAGMVLANGAEVVTLSSGRCRLALDTGRILSVGPLTDVRLTWSASTWGRSVMLLLLKGVIRAEVEGLRAGGYVFGVQAGYALVGVKGTWFEVARDDERVTVSVFRGHVWILQDVVADPAVASARLLELETTEGMKAYTREAGKGLGAVVEEGEQIVIEGRKPLPVPKPIPRGWRDRIEGL